MTFLLGITFVEVLKWIGYVIVALLCLMFMIVVHELGHYTAGKIFKFKINEFSIGFGPAIFKHTNKKNGEVFALRCVPLGGYCAFAGEDGEGASDTETEGNFNSKPPWQRIIVLISGALFNYISAIVIISIFFMAFGEALPMVVSVQDVYSDSEMTVQAQQVLKEGDIILEVEGKKIYSLLDSTEFSRAIEGKDSFTATVIRDGETIEVTVNKVYYNSAQEGEDPQSAYGLGISYAFYQYKMGFFQSIGHSFAFSWDVIALIFRSLGQVFTGTAKVSETLGGTATAIASLAQLTQYGFFAIMYGVCVLSASLAIMNMLPFPALDGSKVVFCLIEWIRGKPINRKVENIIHVVGLVCLLLLAVILDLVHFIG